MSKHFSIGLCLTLPIYLVSIFLILNWDDKICIINKTSIHRPIKINHYLKGDDRIIYLDKSRLINTLRPYILIFFSTIVYLKFASIRDKSKFTNERKYLSDIIYHAKQEGRREARKEISLQLHHSVCGALTAAIFHLETNLIKDPTSPIRNAKVLLREASQKIRLISHNIQAVNNLHYSLQKIVQLYGNEGLKISYKMDEQIVVSEYLDEKELIYIIEELTQNVMKHSQATESTIIIKKKQKHLCLTVHDNGIGFHKNTKHGFGLTNIYQLLFEHQGNIEMSNHRTSGAWVTVSIPSKK